MSDVFYRGGLPLQRSGAFSRPTVPPEYDDPVEMDDQEEEFIVQLKDIVIEVNEDGSWDYEDESYEWAKDNGYKIWYGSDPLTEVQVREYREIVEDVDDLLYPNIPSEAGRYKISGTVHLVYYLTNVSAWVESEPDEDGGSNTTYEYLQEDVEVEFDRDRSYVEDYTVEEVG